jgi:hypothetical protein
LVNLCRNGYKLSLHSRYDNLQICTSRISGPAVHFARTCQLKWNFTFLWRNRDRRKSVLNNNLKNWYYKRNTPSNLLSYKVKIIDKNINIKIRKHCPNFLYYSSTWLKVLKTTTHLVSERRCESRTSWLSIRSVNHLTMFYCAVKCKCIKHVFVPIM